MHRKIILNLAISLDGFIADEQGGYDWIVPSGETSLNTKDVWSHEQFLQSVSAVVMGRHSFDQQLHAGYESKQIYVITSQQLDDHDNIHYLNGNICEEIEILREESEGDIYLFGGRIAIDPILKAGFIDEYIIGIIPVILGQGIPLFRPDNPVILLHLTGQYVEDGIVVLRYVPRQSI